jgi:hypothetical protein
MDQTQKLPLAAMARHHANAGEWNDARTALIQLTEEIIGVAVDTLTINRDQYSLNSLNGFVVLHSGEALFFKYHHEEGEEHTIDEYYNAALLKEAGYPVDVPQYQCGEPGRQILFYRKREDRRLADVCRDLEQKPDPVFASTVIAAQQIADQQTLNCVLTTYATGNPEQIAREPIHQLFYHRLVDAGCAPGFEGRIQRFYEGQTFQLGNISLDWDTLQHACWQINGDRYPITIHRLLTESAIVLNPQHLANHGVVCAHGDAHNANIWFEQSGPQSAHLVYFDPAFAGRQIPALLAEIKATFHNIFAHPFWLYEPDEATRHYQIQVRYQDGVIAMDHNWHLSELRQAFLASKGLNYWQPLLAFLRDRQCLPGNWQQIIRCGLFCCPTLVMPLIAGKVHNPVSSALGWAIAVMLGSGNESLDDFFSQWLVDQGSS